MRPGIERIKITDRINGRGKWRFEFSEARWGAANIIYQSVFSLLPGVVVTGCTLQERQARLDAEMGIDIILGFLSGQIATVQEKILSTNYQTVTVEYMNNPEVGIFGDWFNLMCDFYFVGYSRSKLPICEEWILLDWNRVKLSIDKITWYEGQNQEDGAMASFKYASFFSFPDDCIIAGLAKKRGAYINLGNWIGEGTQLKLF